MWQNVDYEGEPWYYAFSDPDGCLDSVDRKKLVWEAVDLYKGNKKRKAIRGRGFEGELVNTRRDARVGAFVGRLVEGFVETDQQRNSLGVIVWTHAPASWN